MRKCHVGVLVAAAAFLVPAVAGATNIDIHVGGMCSTEWTGGGGGGFTGSFAGETSLNAASDQRDSLSVAAAQLKTQLDTNCPMSGSNTCYVYNYSGGDNVLNYLFATTSYSWKIGYVWTSAGAGGGSRLAGTVASLLTCSYANQLTETAARGAYNHNIPNSSTTTVYRLGGNRQMTASNVACAIGSTLNLLSFGLISGGTCLQSQNDGAVAFQSSGAYSSVGDYSAFWDTGFTHWTNHASFDSLTGVAMNRDQNHYQMKMYGVCLDAGVRDANGLVPGTSCNPTTTWCNASCQYWTTHR
jgi:hypothetical protein